MDDNPETRNANLPQARRLLEAYSSGCQHIYGNDYTVYNVHSVQHLPDDVEFHNMSLSEIAAFPFENHLGKIKKMVRGPTGLIGQVYRRLAEMDQVEPVKTGHPKMKATSQLRDSCFLTRENDYAFVKRVRGPGSYDCQILSKDNVELLFLEPCNSKTVLSIGLARGYQQHLRGHADGGDLVMQGRHFARKVVCLIHLIDMDTVYLIPMLHDAEMAIAQGNYSQENPLQPGQFMPLTSDSESDSEVIADTPMEGESVPETQPSPSTTPSHNYKPNVSAPIDNCTMCTGLCQCGWYIARVVSSTLCTFTSLY
jgi:hypothetical protein